MRIFSKTFNIFVTIATIIVIVLAGSVAVANLLGYTPYVVESGSMEPAIPTGSLVFISKNEKDSVGLDDVVAYEFIGQRSTFMVTHRIVGTDGANWITKGDANENVDANPVSPEQIVGKYAFHIREAGYVYASIGQKGFIMIAAWIVLLNVINVVVASVYNKNKERNKPLEKENKSEDKTDEQNN